MIVFGLAAFDNGVAICQTFPRLVTMQSRHPTPKALMRALLTPTSFYNLKRLEVLSEAVQRLSKKSRSFFLASAVFTGPLRTDLIFLFVSRRLNEIFLSPSRYSFCRIADDLIDGAGTCDEADEWIQVLSTELDHQFGPKRRINPFADRKPLRETPKSARHALDALPTKVISRQPFDGLLHGFLIDARFLTGAFPIEDQRALEAYAALVAGTVAESIIELCLYHCGEAVSASQRSTLCAAGVTMGKALQLVNIARDISVDAAPTMLRVYLPTTWLAEVGLKPSDVLVDPHRAEIGLLRKRLLKLAFEFYKEARPKMEMLPKSVRGPMRVAVESYMEIGRVIDRGDVKENTGRASVPILRRLYVAWCALRG